MPDIISARCAGCGHVIRVPAALGGKKAKCPQCAAIIIIPKPAGEGGEFIPDDQLPEVARDEDLLEEEVLREAEPPVAEPVRPARATGMRRGGLKGGRYGGARASRGGSSAAPWVVAGVAGVVLVGVLLAVAMGGGGARPTAGGGPPDPSSAQVRPLSEAELALWNRFVEYTRVFNSRNLLDTLQFYTFPASEEMAVKRTISGQWEREVKYADVSHKSVRVEGDAGTVTFTHAGGTEATLHWRRVDGAWLIVP